MADQCKVTNSPSRNNGGISAALRQWASPHERSKTRIVLLFLFNILRVDQFGEYFSAHTGYQYFKKLVPK
jgi:hypothetical protein